MVCIYNFADPFDCHIVHPHSCSPVSRSQDLETIMPRGTSYADNSFNRSMGRVGAPMGSMPASSGSSGGGSLSSGGGYSPGYGSSSGSSYSAGAKSASSSTYVDNSYNRSVGRVGAQKGSMPVSRSASGSSSSGYSDGGYSPASGYSSSGSYSPASPATYVDNAYNRSVGRVGVPKGSMPVSRSSLGGEDGGYSPGSGYSSGGSLFDDSPSGSTATYVDNAYNRRVGRVGALLGSMSISKSSSGSSKAGELKTSEPICNLDKSSFKTPSKTRPSELKCYVDSPMNRRLGRVGQPIGSAPHSKKSGTENRCYVDNTLNRELHRVGLPVGTKPFSSVSKSQNKRKSSQPTHQMRKLYEGLLYNPETPDFDNFNADVSNQEQEYMVDKVLDLVRRMNQIEKWQKTNPGEQAKTVIKPFKYDGPTIPFEEINLGQKIGQGGFGDVHFAKWTGSIVAVKKLRVQRVSLRRLRQFQDEVKVLCRLDHPHIVKFLGACIVTPNLAIVMEYMQKSLYEALHVEEVDYSDAEQYQIVTGMAYGLDYLHRKLVAHCDIKSTNILLDIPKDGVVAKISDFGLSMMKNETETSQSVAKVVQGVGTPKYSAPEVLAGSELDQVAMCKADVYSMSLVAWEVICQEEPFFGLNIHQLQRRVMGGVGEVELKIPDDVIISGGLLSLLKECWSRNANKRPSAGDFKKRAARCGGIQ